MTRAVRLAKKGMRTGLIALLTVCPLLWEASRPCKAAAPEEPDFVVAAMCVEPKRWDKAHNFALLERYARDAAKRGASLVVTCKGFLDGYKSNPKFMPDFYERRSPGIYHELLELQAPATK